MVRPSIGNSSYCWAWHCLILLAAAKSTARDNFASASFASNGIQFSWASSTSSLLRRAFSLSTKDYDLRHSTSESPSYFRQLSSSSHSNNNHHHSSSHHSNATSTTNSTKNITSSHFIVEGTTNADDETNSTLIGEKPANETEVVTDITPSSTNSSDSLSSGEYETGVMTTSATMENVTESNAPSMSSSFVFESSQNLTASTAPSMSSSFSVETSQNLTIGSNAPSVSFVFPPEPSYNMTITGNETTVATNETETETDYPTYSPTFTPTKAFPFKDEESFSNENFYGNSNVENGNIKKNTLSNSPVLLGIMLAFFLGFSLCTIYFVKMNPDGLCATIVRCFGLITWSIITCPFKLCGICTRRGRDGFDEAGEYYSNQDRYVARDLELH